MITLDFKHGLYLCLAWADLGSGIPRARPHPPLLDPEKAVAGGAVDGADVDAVAVAAAVVGAVGPPPLLSQVRGSRCETAGSQSPAPWA
jgi:hypothetical protein